MVAVGIVKNGIVKTQVNSIQNVIPNATGVLDAMRTIQTNQMERQGGRVQIQRILMPQTEGRGAMVVPQVDSMTLILQGMAELVAMEPMVATEDGVVTAAKHSMVRD